MFCKNCGNKVDDNGKFCNVCGESLVDDVKVVNNVNSQNEPAKKITPDDYFESKKIEVTGEGIILSSSLPIPSKTAWVKWPLIISGLLICASGIGIITGAILLFVENMQREYHEAKMRQMKFIFPYNVSAAEIYNVLRPILVNKYGNVFEFEQDDERLSVIYDQIIYDINLQGDGTICIWWRRSFAKAFFSWNSFKQYKKIRTGTSLIAYELQQAFNVK